MKTPRFTQFLRSAEWISAIALGAKEEALELRKAQAERDRTQEESDERTLGAKIKMWMHTLETGGNLVGEMMENASLAKMFMRVATELEPEIAGEIGLRIMAGVSASTREELRALLETHGVTVSSEDPEAPPPASDRHPRRSSAAA